MMQQISIVESQSVTLRMSDAQANEFQRLGKELASRSTWWNDDEQAERSVIDCRKETSGFWRIVVREAVGVICAGDLQVIVVPKIPMAHFLYLAGHSEIVPRIDDTPIDVGVNKDLWHIFAHWFLVATERLLRRELARDYGEQVDILQFMRGRVVPLETASLFYSGRAATYNEFEEFDEDTPLNRVIKAAAQVIAGNSFLTQTLRQRAKKILARTSSVGTLKHGDTRTTVDRLTAHYRGALSFAKYVLQNVAVRLQHGNGLGWAFLIRTPEVVESGVRHVMREGLAGRWRVAKKELRVAGSNLTLNPDLVFEDGVAVGDVKYKRAANEWQRPDLYQIVTFATGFRSTKACLVNFSIDDEGVAAPSVTIGKSEVTNIRWRATNETTPEEAARELMVSVESWLRDSRADTDRAIA